MKTIDKTTTDTGNIPEVLTYDICTVTGVDDAKMKKVDNTKTQKSMTQYISSRNVSKLLNDSLDDSVCNSYTTVINHTEEPISILTSTGKLVVPVTKMTKRKKLPSFVLEALRNEKLLLLNVEHLDYVSALTELYNLMDDTETEFRKNLCPNLLSNQLDTEYTSPYPSIEKSDTHRYHTLIRSLLDHAEKIVPNEDPAYKSADETAVPQFTRDVYTLTEKHGYVCGRTIASIYRGELTKAVVKEILNSLTRHRGTRLAKVNNVSVYTVTVLRDIHFVDGTKDTNVVFIPSMYLAITPTYSKHKNVTDVIESNNDILGFDTRVSYVTKNANVIKIIDNSNTHDSYFIKILGKLETLSFGVDVNMEEGVYRSDNNGVFTHITSTLNIKDLEKLGVYVTKEQEVVNSLLDKRRSDINDLDLKYSDIQAKLKVSDDKRRISEEKLEHLKKSNEGAVTKSFLGIIIAGFALAGTIIKFFF